MSEHKGHLVDDVALDAATEVLAVADMIREELGYLVGSEEVGARETRAKIRRALAGDEPAFLEVLEMVGQQQTSPNPMVREIGIVVDEHLRQGG